MIQPILLSMISVQEALNFIAQSPLNRRIQQVDLLDSIGKILAEDVIADRDFPPFNRVAMDGIAITYEARTTWTIEKIQYAGTPQLALEQATHGIEVMTGAILPAGCDTVIRYEDLDIRPAEGSKQARLVVPLEEIKKGQHVHQKGIDRKEGSVILAKGLRITPAEIAILATVGKTQVWVEMPPKVAIISTGDELVEINETPLSYQIRQSNSYMLASALQQHGIKAQRFHLIDDPAVLSQRLANILENHDILLLSGGVSAGKKDYVPEILRALGVQQRFHKVAQKPGKPFWFGTKKNETGSITQLVFALPGNPVSTFLCFLQYAQPVITNQILRYEEVHLAQKVYFKPSLTYFAPAKTYFDEGKQMALPFEGSGSADFANLTSCDGFVLLPAEQQEFPAGTLVKFIRFR